MKVEMEARFEKALHALIATGVPESKAKKLLGMGRK
jgi:hypothetical protein